MREIAYAKLNLALHVRAREADGYHRIETVFAFCEDGDGLEVSASDRIELMMAGEFAQALSPAGIEAAVLSPGQGQESPQWSGEGAPGQRSSSTAEPPHPSPLPAGEREQGQNLVTRAALALRAHYGVQAGARIHLHKNLPVAAGLGGGSADAAAALRLLVRFWNLPYEPAVLEEIARPLGADVPACVASRTVRGSGRGDVLAAVDGAALSGRPVLLVNPRVPVPTGPVFKAWDGVDRGALGIDLLGRNDLEAPALSLAPEIGAVLDALAGAPFVRMSGSGATCLALYGDEANRDAAAERIGAAHPGWWTMASRLR